MKILLAVPGHLRTVPMGRYSFDALRALGHEVVMFDYHGGLLDRFDDRWRGLIRRFSGGGAAEEKRSVNDYRSAGVSQVYFLPTACDPAVHRASRPRPEYACDVCFAGDWSPLREQVMESLAREFEVRG